ncbi:MAG: HAD hydrolase-like protein [Candidatus Bathyarchaeia archaeon]|jgi:ribonucleotide monophosphatase NagD (HAD superfamily)
MSRRSSAIFVVVGDLLDRDIRIGNRIGAITVLRLGGYKPNQNPSDKMEKPDYVISEIPELLRIVAREERLRTR